MKLLETSYLQYYENKSSINKLWKFLGDILNILSFLLLLQLVSYYSQFPRQSFPPGQVICLYQPEQLSTFPPSRHNNSLSVHLFLDFEPYLSKLEEFDI